MPTPPERSAGARRLTRADWAAAALTAIGEGGLGAIAVEPIAERLGATKGSFYWHFSNRDALVEAALRLWEDEHTEGVIAAMAAEPDPARRLRQLLTVVLRSAAHDRIEVALAATAEHPLIAPVVQRMTERRVSYVASLFEELGMAPRAARHRAVLAVSVYLGHLQLAHVAPDVLPPDAHERAEHLDAVIEALMPSLLR